jgi:hypothetical protein
LQFHAGVSGIDPDDSVKSALDRVAECLALARQDGSPTRVYWQSKRQPGNFPPDSPEARIYADALTKFSTGAS